MSIVDALDKKIDELERRIEAWAKNRRRQTVIDKLDVKVDALDKKIDELERRIEALEP